MRIEFRRRTDGLYEPDPLPNDYVAYDGQAEDADHREIMKCIFTTQPVSVRLYGIGFNPEGLERDLRAFFSGTANYRDMLDKISQIGQNSPTPIPLEFRMQVNEIEFLRALLRIRARRIAAGFKYDEFGYFS